MGTASSDFVSQTLYQLQAAARLPMGGISEIGVNSALSIIEAAKPDNEMEAALVIQMACTHAASMAVLSRLGGGHGGDRHVAMMAAAASKLLRAYALQVETFRRLRAGGSQFMRIEHVHIEANAQAVIGNVQNTGEDNDPRTLTNLDGYLLKDPHRVPPSFSAAGFWLRCEQIERFKSSSGRTRG